MKLNVFKLIIFLFPIIFFSIFLILIYFEYKAYLVTNKNITFGYFIKSNILKVINFDINSKRVKERKIDKSFYSYDDFTDNGFLLVSGYNLKNKTSNVILFSIKDEKILHTWQPPINKIHEGSKNFTSEYNLKKNYRMQHPLLLKNGDLIFSSGEGPLVKIDKCSNYIWSNNRHFHHSIEEYNEKLIIAPMVLNDNLGKNYPILNHGFALVNKEDGSIKKKFSIFKILEDNNKIGLLYGVGEFEYDRIHLNDAEVIIKSDKFVQRGDIMLSSKHLSTVFLYRPKNNSIIWLKTGPWLNQHDVDYLGDGKFSIFGNDTFRYNKVDTHDVFLSQNNKIYIYDLNNDEIKTIYEKTMAEIKTPTQGLHEILDNGDVFIEDTDNFRLTRLSDKNKRWDYFNYLGENKIGSIHWSRYLNEENKFEWMNNINC